MSDARYLKNSGDWCSRGSQIGRSKVRPQGKRPSEARLFLAGDNSVFVQAADQDFSVFAVEFLKVPRMD
jgi:hypothetical protein